MRTRATDAVIAWVALVSLAGCGASSGGGSSTSGSMASLASPSVSSGSTAPTNTTPAGTATPGMVPLSTSTGSTPNMTSGGQGSGTTTTTAPDAHVAAALALVNQSRASAGLTPLTLDANLSAVALRHATDDFVPSAFSYGSNGPCHDWTNGDTGGSLAENAGTLQIGTNGASDEDHAFAQIHQTMLAGNGNADLDAYVVNAAVTVPPRPWAGPTTTGRYGNLMDPSYTKIGIGLYVDGNQNLVVVEDLE